MSGSTSALLSSYIYIKMAQERSQNLQNRFPQTRTETARTETRTVLFCSTLTERQKIMIPHKHHPNQRTGTGRAVPRPNCTRTIPNRGHPASSHEQTHTLNLCGREWWKDHLSTGNSFRLPSKIHASCKSAGRQSRSDIGTFP